jgi:hypothetical protein
MYQLAAKAEPGFGKGVWMPHTNKLQQQSRVTLGGGFKTAPAHNI